MTLREEIIKYFRYLEKNKLFRIENVKQESYVVHLQDFIGVLIPYKNNKIFEKFNNIELRTLMLENDEKEYLALLMNNYNYINEFSLICEDFLRDDKNYRDDLIEDPLNWWKKWCDLLGNKNYSENIYSLLGELIIYWMCLKEDSTSKWYGASFCTHDIESNSFSVEVKSTTQKYGTIIHINSQYQLKTRKNPLYLYFCRFEKSVEGISINDIINKFDSHQSYIIKEQIRKMGYKLENHIFNEKYKVLEIKRYLVDDEFPVFDDKKYSDSSFFNHVVKIEYTVSLDSLRSDIIDKELLK